jgi:hypothetical protein
MIVAPDHLVVSVPRELFNSRILVSIKAEERIAAGMSGSPIITDEGVAVGALSLGQGGAHLPFSLPGWMLREDLWK